MIKGYLVVMNGNCERDLNGIYTVFIPTRNKDKAMEYVSGNGDIIELVPYEVDLTKIDEAGKDLILSRIAFLQD